MKMIKRNKIKLIISSLIILLPTLLSFFGGRFLPEEIAVHWGFDGKADGFMKPASIFLIFPLILLALHWLCLFVEAIVNKNTEQNKKLTEIILWIIPALSIIVSASIFSVALGYKINNMFMLINLLLGVMFIIIGNYMPKSTRNKTVGIKIKWAQSNDENWNATHRLAGKLYVICGLIFILAIPLPLPTVAFPFIVFPVVLASVLVPIIYSYAFYKKQLREGKVTKEDYKKGYNEIVSTKDKKIAIVISVVLSILLVVFLPIIMFTGNIDATLDGTSLNIKASFASELTLKLSDIDEIEYREGGVDGTRVVGFASARLLTGAFQNEELGNYTRYTYTGKKPCIIIKAGNETYVLSLDNAEETKALYDEIFSRIAE